MGFQFVIDRMFFSRYFRGKVWKKGKIIKLWNIFILMTESLVNWFTSLKSGKIEVLNTGISETDFTRYNFKLNLHL